MLLDPVVFATSCAALARSMILAKPRLADGAPFAVDGGVGDDVVPGFGIDLDVGCCVDRCGPEDEIGLEVELCCTPGGLELVAPFPLNWNRLDGAVGIAFFTLFSDSDLATFGLGALSGSSDLRFTPAAALFGASLTPLVAVVSFRISLLGWDGFCWFEEGCCDAWGFAPIEESMELKDYDCESERGAGLEWDRERTDITRSVD